MPIRAPSRVPITVSKYTRFILRLVFIKYTVCIVCWYTRNSSLELRDYLGAWLIRGSSINLEGNLLKVSPSTVRSTSYLL
jgi:hypothetical protein